MGKRLASSFMALALLACGNGTPESQVRRAFEACRAGVEAGDAATASAPLDPAFRGPGGMDRSAARLFLATLLRRDKVGITVLRSEVEVRGPEALQEVDLLLTGRQGGLLPEDATRRTFGLRWRRKGQEWRLLELREEVSPPGTP